MHKLAGAVIIIVALYLTYGCTETVERPEHVPETTVSDEIQEALQIVDIGESVIVYKMEAEPKKERYRFEDEFIICYPFTVYVYQEGESVDGFIQAVTGRYLLVGENINGKIYGTWNQGNQFGEFNIGDNIYQLFTYNNRIECEGELT